MKITSLDRPVIQGDWDLNRIDSSLKDALRGKRLWGELNLSRQEGDFILSQIKKSIGTLDYFNNLKRLFSTYPVVFISDMISFIIFEYDNNFWTDWASRLGLSLSTPQQSELGRIIRQTLQIHDFQIIRNEGFIYVSTLLYQAGIPGVSYQRLFELLHSSLDNPYVHAHDILDEITGSRKFMVDKPVTRFFSNHPDGPNYLQNLRDMMRELNDISDQEELPEITGIPTIVIEQYKKWCSSFQTGARKKLDITQYYVSPKLAYDQTKGLCLWIPEQAVHDDTLYRLRWEIKTIEPMIDLNITQDIFLIQGQNQTHSTYVSIPPSKKYEIHLYNDDFPDTPLQPPWTLTGISPQTPLLAFDENGLAVNPTRLRLDHIGNVFVYLQNTIRITQSRSVLIDPLYLSMDWNDFEAIHCLATNRDAFIFLEASNSSWRIDATKYFDISLFSKATLFDESPLVSELPVFTEFPALKINGILEQDFGQLKNLKVVLIDRSINRKITTSWSDSVEPLDTSSNCFDLKPWIANQSGLLYGRFEIKIYQGNELLKQFVFYVVPRIRYDLNSYSITHSDDNKSTVASFCVPKEAFDKMKFHEPVHVNDYILDAPWVEIIPETQTATLTGFFQYSSFLIPFHKTLRDLEWQVWSDDPDQSLTSPGIVKQFNIEELSSSNWLLRIYIASKTLAENNCYLQLMGKNGIIHQQKQLRLDHHNKCFINLNQFEDTIKNQPLPQQLVICFNDTKPKVAPILIGSISSYVEMRNLRYTTVNGKPAICWVQDPNQDFSNTEIDLEPLQDQLMPVLRVRLNSIHKFKDQSGTALHGIYLNAPLPDGVFKVNPISRDNLSFFNDKDPVIRVFDHSHLLMVNGRAYLDHHFSHNVKETHPWLAALMVALGNEQWLNQFEIELEKSLRPGPWSFDSVKCAFLLFSLVLSAESPNIPKRTQEVLKRIIRRINERIITNQNRTELLKILLDLDLSHLDANLVIDDLQLYLYRPSHQAKFNRTLMKRLWNLNNEFAILVHLRKSSNPDYIDIENIVQKIGDMALSKALSPQPLSKYLNKTMGECLHFLLNSEKHVSEIKFRHSSRLWGDKLASHKKMIHLDKHGITRDTISMISEEYEVLGKNYNRLVSYAYAKGDGIIHQNFPDVQAAYLIIDHLVDLNNNRLKRFEEVITARGESGVDQLFTNTARAAMLTALSHRNLVSNHDIQKLLPFWRLSKTVSSELVYRDLIMAELYSLTMP